MKLTTTTKTNKNPVDNSRGSICVYIDGDLAFEFLGDFEEIEKDAKSAVSYIALSGNFLDKVSIDDVIGYINDVHCCGVHFEDDEYTKHNFIDWVHDISESNDD